MKLAVTGKGGVGKTTFSALVCAALAARKYQVYAIDADPNTTLLGCLGYAHPERVQPLVNLTDLIEERTGMKPGTMGGMFRLNPFVADIPADYAVDVNGVRVLVAGAVKKGGSGCYCPENAMVRALISHLLLEKDVALVIDMEAGIEHLSRGTVDSVDQLVIVTEPSRAGVETARRIHRLAQEIGLRRMLAVGNRIRSETDQRFLTAALPELTFAGFIPYDERLSDAERAGRPAGGASAAADAAAAAVVAQLEAHVQRDAVP